MDLPAFYSPSVTTVSSVDDSFIELGIDPVTRTDVPAGTDSGLVTVAAVTEPIQKDNARAWAVCGLAFLIKVVTIGVLQAFGVFYVQFLEEFGPCNAEAAWVGSGAYGLTLLLGFVSCSFINQYGHRTALVVGCVLCASSLITTSYITSIQLAFLTFSVLYGIGATFTYTSTMTVADVYFDKYFSVATGIMTAGSSCGTLIVCPVAQVLSDYYGWRMTFRILAAACLLCTACGWIIGPSRSVSEFVSDQGSWRTQMVASMELWKEKPYVIYVLSITLVMFGYFIPYVHLVSYVNDIGLGHSNGYILMMALGASTATGRVTFGHLVPFCRMNKIHLQQLALLLLGTASIILPLIKTLPGLLLYVILAGLIDGCYMVLLPQMTRILAGPRFKLCAWGYMVGSFSITFTLGPPVAGWMYEATSSYGGSFQLAGALILVGACCMFFISAPSILVMSEPCNLPPETKTSEEKHVTFNLEPDSSHVIAPCRFLSSDLMKGVFPQMALEGRKARRQRTVSESGTCATHNPCVQHIEAGSSVAANRRRRTVSDSQGEQRTVSHSQGDMTDAFSRPVFLTVL